MKTLFLEIVKSKQLVSRKQESKLLWYNIQEKKLQEFIGGRLSFRYDRIKRAMIPFVEDVIIDDLKIINNKDQILNWINNNKVYISSFEVQDSLSQVCIELEDKDFSYIASSLERSGINYI